MGTEERLRDPLAAKDRFLIGLLAFYVVMAFTIELYFVVKRPELAALADTEFFARCFEIYAAGDRQYFDGDWPWMAMALEVFNIFVTQWLNMLLIYAIIQRTRYRYPLQLLIGAYLGYSVLLYFLTGHISGYRDMPVHDAWGFFIFYAPNLPWLLGPAYMVYDGFRAIVPRMDGGVETA